MKITHFATEHFFARYEFTTPYQLCNSDCETIPVEQLLDLAGVSPDELGRVSLGYTESAGNPALRETIAGCYQTVSPEQVIFLGSPIEGIYLTARAVLNPGDEVVALSPAYDALINMFEHIVGADHVRKWQFRPGKTQWELDFDKLETLINPKTKMVVVNFPHNPTGFLPTQAQFDQLIQIVNKHRLVLFCDEMYFGLVHEGIPAVRSAVDQTSQAIVLSGLSKIYGLPGLRSGWLIVKDQALREELFNWKFYTSICPAAPTEFLSLAALKIREQLRQRSLAYVEQNLKLADAFFSRQPDLFTWRRPLAGSTALVEMHVPSVEVFAEKMAQEAGVLIQPATTLGWDDHAFRMGLGRAGYGVALQKFEEYINKE